ncbi:MAG: hypothetical protein L3K23_06375 [Thermoplasmata archaeon]|nr:hypothetical protein [Thermoplasmata archaeon]
MKDAADVPPMDRGAPPWGSNILAPAPPGPRHSRWVLDLPSPAFLGALASSQRVVANVPGEQFALDLQAHLVARDFQVARSTRLHGSRQWGAAGFVGSVGVVLAERGLQLDRTLTRRLRVQTLALAAGFFALVGLTVLLRYARWSIPWYLALPFALAVPVVGLLAFFRLGTNAFWSEVIYVAVGTGGPGDGGAPSTGGAEPGLLVRGWAGLVCSQNGGTQRLVIRSPKRGFPSSSLSEVLDELLDEGVRASSPPLRA